MQSWDLSEIGDYVMAAGVPRQTDSLAVPAYIRMKAPAEGWMYAPDVTWGSNLHQFKKRQANIDISGVENTALQAVQPLIADGRASRIQVDFDASARGGIGINTRITQASGLTETFNFSGLG